MPELCGKEARFQQTAQSASRDVEWRTHPLARLGHDTALGQSLSELARSMEQWVVTHYPALLANRNEAALKMRANGENPCS
jgi:hypothetical protein